MKLKLDDKGNVVVQDDKPVFVDDQGKEVVFDYAHTVGTISRLNGEAKAHREEKQALAEKLKAYEGIDDPEAARGALETVKNLDSKKLFEAGKVDEIKAEAKRAFDEQLKGIRKEYEPVVAERDQFKNAYNNELIGGAFNRSKFISDKLAIPADLVQAAFGKAFSLDGDKVVAKDSSGNPIYSRAKPGEIAGFDEALEHLVDQYPNRDSILKGSGASGSGASNSTAGTGGKRQMSRAQFDSLSPMERTEAIRTVTVVD